MKLHEKIKELRRSKGISQTYVAKKLNITVSGYSMKETGKRSITTNELEEIAKALEVSASIFFKDEFHVKCNDVISKQAI